MADNGCLTKMNLILIQALFNRIEYFNRFNGIQNNRIPIATITYSLALLKTQKHEKCLIGKN